MSDGKHAVTEYLFRGRNYDDDVPDSVIEFIGWLNGLLENVPVDRRETVEIEISGSEYSAEIEISYSRPETDSEQKARVQQHNKYVAETEAREREQLASLKRKYE